MRAFTVETRNGGGYQFAADDWKIWKDDICFVNRLPQGERLVFVLPSRMVTAIRTPEGVVTFHFNSMYDKYDKPTQGEKPMVNTEQVHYIVIGSSGAAPRPHQHNSLYVAEEEAQRLARANRGVSFTVYSTVIRYQAEEAPLTKTEYAPF